MLSVRGPVSLQTPQTLISYAQTFTCNLPPCCNNQHCDRYSIYKLENSSSLALSLLFWGFTRGEPPTILYTTYTILWWSILVKVEDSRLCFYFILFSFFSYLRLRVRVIMWYHMLYRKIKKVPEQWYYTICLLYIDLMNDAWPLG